MLHAFLEIAKNIIQHLVKYNGADNLFPSTWESVQMPLSKINVSVFFPSSG